MNSHQKIYTDIANIIKKSEEYTLEIDDITFLFSSSKKKIDRIIKSKDETELNSSSNDLLKNNKTVKMLSYNIKTDFYKLISTPTFLTQMKMLCDKYNSDFQKKNIINPFLGIFTPFHSLSTINVEHYKIGEENFRKYVMHGVYKNDQPLIPKMLLSLYLEACIAQYHNILNYTKNLYETSIDFEKENDLLKLKQKVHSWLQYRTLLFNKLNSTQKKESMYDDGKTTTYNLNNFTFFSLPQYYDKIELEKIKCLCRCRTESFNKTKDGNLRDIDDFFSSKMLVEVKLLNYKIAPNVRDEITYTIFQAIHAYDQIIHQLVHTRYEYLTNLRLLLEQQELDTEIEKILPTLQQYLKYPLMFQHQTNNVDKLYLLLSEDTMKILLLKYLKLLSINKYCKKNNIDLKGGSTKSLELITSKNCKFYWNKIDNVKSEMHKILIKINETKYEMTSYLPKDLTLLATELKKSLKLILTYINNDPMGNLDIGYEAKMDKSKIDIEYSDFNGKIPNLPITNLSLDQGNLLDGTDQLFIEDIQSEYDNVDSFIENYNYNLKQIQMYSTQIKTYIDRIFKGVKELQDAYINTVKFIDKTNSGNFSDSYKGKNDSDINNEHEIDYNSIKANDDSSDIHKILTDMNEGIVDPYNTIQSNFDLLYIYLSDLNGIVGSLTTDLDNVKSSSDILKSKIKKLIDDRNTENTNKKKENTEKTTEITNKKKEIAQKNLSKLFLSAISKKTPPKIGTKIKKLEQSIQEETTKINDLKTQKSQLQKEIDDNDVKIKQNDDELTYLNNIDTSKTIENTIKYCTDNETKVTNLQTSFNTFNTTINDPSTFYTECKNVIQNASNTFYEMEKFISIFIRKNAIDFNIDNHKNFELHRIKVSMFELSNLALQNFNGRRNGTNYLVYLHNHKSLAFINGITQIFKNFRKNDYHYTNITNVKEKLDGKSDDLKNNDDKFNDYIGAYETQHENIKIKDNFYDKYYDNKDDNFSVYQLIDYLNKDMVFNMGEKLYEYLVALGEIEKLPSIDFIISYLQSKQYKSSGTGIRQDMYNVHYNTTLYGNGNVKINDSLKNMLTEIFTNTKPFNEITVNTFDANNRITFDVTKIFDLIDTFDEYKFIKYFFKTIRHANVQISPDISAFKQTTIPYDDLFYYRQHIDLRYKLNEFSYEPLYYSYFALGSMCSFDATPPRINEFSNKANELMVQIIEFTNGKL